MATHSGTFHADDVFAFAILTAATGGQLTLLRSRDAARLAEADVVFDVGGIFDPARHRYDHHMRDRPMRDDGAPFSSAGLVWREFGERAVVTLIGGTDAATAQAISRALDDGLIREIDLMDNGAATAMAGHISTLIEAWNPTFAEAPADENKAFLVAADLAGQILLRAARQAEADILAAATVAAAADQRDHPGVLVLDRRLPWEDAVFALGLTDALYVVRPAGADWTCSAVPPQKGSFDQKLPLPADWAGLQGDALAAVSGIADATFCHPARFVCGAKSREGAIALARRAIALAGE